MSINTVLYNYIHINVSFTHPNVFSNMYDLLSYVEHPEGERLKKDQSFSSFKRM